MNPLHIMLAAIAGVAVGFAIARAILGGRETSAEQLAEDEAKRIIDAAVHEVEELKRAAEVEGKELAFKLKSDVEEEIRTKKSAVAKKDEALAKRERDLLKQRKDAEKKLNQLSKRERGIESKEKSAEASVKKAEAAQERANAKLEEVAGMSAEDARGRLEDDMRANARKAAAEDIKKIEEEANEQAAAKSKQIIATTIQRYASEFVQERTVSVVPLPSDDMKGRLIGREGRNIRALEAATGIDMIIDDTAEMITISCFNPVRREIARLAIAKLVSDGRIHPTRIEEVVRKAQRQIDKLCKEAGEQAAFDLGLHKLHPELMLQLGRLKYRSSYAQNLLQHSIEVGFLAGLMASEVGINAKNARRAGLLHDIGKSVDHEIEGAHAVVGGQMCRKYGEPAKVCQAIASHHGEPGPRSILDHIVHAANDLSVARPGARRELLASYIQRLEDMEKLCIGFDGVNKAFALQAGREVRVMVQNDKIDDAQALMLSKDIARKLETDISYPGHVRVVVVRETRASEYAH